MLYLAMLQSVKLSSILLSIIVFFSCSASVMAQSDSSEFMEGIVRSVENNLEVDGLGEEYLVQSLKLEITKGSLLGSKVIVENNTISSSNARLYDSGDRLVVLHSVDIEGNDLFFVTDYVRRSGLLVLALFFVGLALLIGGKWGAFSLIGMGLSFVVIFTFVLPQIIKGYDPVLVAVSGSALIIPITFYLSHGINRKTNIAIIGTLITLVLTGLLAVYFVDLTRLTGFASEEAVFLQVQKGGLINMKGLLLAGIIIGTLGILDDITISQASIVEELRKANKNLDSKELFLSAMRVGRDHIASLINTLVLVYTGASLPLLLLFINNPSPVSDIINMELVADEIVRTLVGSIGLILAVPVTTFLAALSKR